MKATIDTAEHCHFRCMFFCGDYRVTLVPVDNDPACHGGMNIYANGQIISGVLHKFEGVELFHCAQHVQPMSVRDGEVAGAIFAHSLHDAIEYAQNKP